MNLNDAIVKRIDEICKEQNSNVCDIALRGGMSPSAIYDIIKGRTKCSKVITVKRFCEGAGITLAEFFDKGYFNELEEDWAFIIIIASATGGYDYVQYKFSYNWLRTYTRYRLQNGLRNSLQNGLQNMKNSLQ